MSIKAMGRVWDLDLPHAERLVLLALADHADHIGDNIYPSVGLIAWKTGYSERQVQRIIKRLCDLQILCVVAQPIGKTTVYRMDLEAGVAKEPYLRQNVGGDKMSGVTKRPPKPRQNVTPTPDIAMSPKPSLNRQEPKDAAAVDSTADKHVSDSSGLSAPKTVVGALMDLTLSKGQALNFATGLKLTLDDVAAWREWLVHHKSKDPPIGLMINHLKDGRTRPPVLERANGKATHEIPVDENGEVPHWYFHGGRQ